MPGARCGTLFSSISMPVPAARRRFASGTRQSRRAHVLDARHGVGRQQFQAGFAHQFFHERIAHLHRAALLPGDSLVKSCEAKAAPANPSRPVAGPT